MVLHYLMCFFIHTDVLITLHGKSYFLFADVLKRWSFQKNRAGIWYFLYYGKRWYFFFPKIWSCPLDGKWKMIFLKKYTEIYFLQMFWKDGLFSRDCAGTWSFLHYLERWYFFSRKHDIFSSGGKWEVIFFRKYMEIWNFLCTRTGVTNVTPCPSAKKSQGWSCKNTPEGDWCSRLTF